MPRPPSRAQSDVQNTQSVGASEQSRTALRWLGRPGSALSRAAVNRALPRFARSRQREGCYPEQHNSQGIFGAELHSPRYKAARGAPIDNRGSAMARKSRPS